MPYFLDGNNLIGLARRRSRPSEEDRSALLAELSERLRSNRSTVRVFFDGGPGRPITLGRLVASGDGGSADDAILRELRKAADRGQITVVTADRELSRRVRDEGGKTLTPNEFWSRLSASATPSPKESRSIDVDDWMNYFADPKNRSR